MHYCKIRKLKVHEALLLWHSVLNLPMRLAFPIRVWVQVPAALLSVQVPASAPARAAADGLNAGAADNHTGP